MLLKRRFLLNWFFVIVLLLNWGVVSFGQGQASSKWKVYDDKGILFQYPAIFSVKEYVDKKLNLKMQGFRLFIECSLYSEFRIELYDNASVDDVLASHLREKNPPSFQQWLADWDLSSEVVQIGGRKAFKLRITDFGQTRIYSDGLYIAYHDPVGCTSDPEITNDFENIVSSIKFHVSK